MPMKNPPHPGRGLKQDCAEAGLSITEAARKLGVARVTFSRVLNGKAGISPKMALKLEAAGWSNADFWMRLQAAYDLAQVRLRREQEAA